MSGTAPAPVAPLGEVFSRRATGLVRLGTPWRVLTLNFANIGLTYIWFTFWITPGVFPRSNLFLSLAVAGIGTAVFAVVLAAFSSSFPRSGGDYVYVSRTLRPAIGFGCSVAAALSQCFWIGIGGFRIANLVLAPVPMRHPERHCAEASRCRPAGVGRWCPVTLDGGQPRSW